MSKGIRFKKRELDLISDMCAIASANEWGEGDYMDWGEKDAEIFASVHIQAYYTCTNHRFTFPELDLICRMCAIATATGWGEGDYMEWTEKHAKTFDNLHTRASLEFLYRKGVSQ